LYREWTRNRSDVDRLPALHNAIGECLGEHDFHDAGAVGDFTSR
jgi:hypothetical protein